MMKFSSISVRAIAFAAAAMLWAPISASAAGRLHLQAEVGACLEENSNCGISQAIDFEIYRAAGRAFVPAGSVSTDDTSGVLEMVLPGGQYLVVPRRGGAGQARAFQLEMKEAKAIELSENATARLEFFFPGGHVMPSGRAAKQKVIPYLKRNGEVRTHRIASAR